MLLFNLLCHISRFPVEGSSNMFTPCDVSQNKSLSKKKFFCPHFLLVFSFKILNPLVINLPNSQMDISSVEISKKNVTCTCEHGNPKLVCRQNIHLMYLLLDLVVCFTWANILNLPHLVMKGRLLMMHNICHVWLPLVLPAQPPPKPEKHSVQYTPFQLR